MSRKSLSAFALLIASAALLWPTDVHANGRHRHGVVIVGGGFYGYPVFYRPYWGPAWGWYPYPFGPYAPYPYPFWGYYNNASSVRVQVTPKQAEVYVDGYFVGTVDDFDGFSQRLDLVPGEHELTVYMPGYRIYREKQLFRPRASYKVQHALEPLAPGEPAPERPTPAATASSRRQNTGGPGPSRTRPPREHTRLPQDQQQSDFGTLSLRTDPPDAQVLIDGKPWDRMPGETGPFVIQLSAGPHRIEVRKDDMRPVTRDVDIQPGDTIRISITLEPGGSSDRL